MAADRKPVIKIHQLNKTFFIREKQIRTIRDSILHFKRFKANHHKIVALEDINFEVMEGDIYGIIGSNGSGKSTLLNIILGSMRPDKGSMIQTKGKIIRLALGMGFDPELTLFSYQIGRAKPSVMLYDLMGERLALKGIPRSSTLYVGNDMLNDIRPAKQAGYQTALFAGDARSLRMRENDASCRDLASDMVVVDLLQLVDFLDQQVNFT